jgi:hypothetical protein
MNATATATAKTMEQIMTEEREAHTKWERETVADVVNGQSYTIADFRKITDAVFVPGNWKAAWAAAVPSAMVAVVSAAVCHYHGRRPRIVGIQPITGKVLMEGDGYACY